MTRKTWVVMAVMIVLVIAAMAVVRVVWFPFEWMTR